MADTRIRELPETDRPREKLMERGAPSLSDAELLAIFLRTGTPGRGAIDVARELLTARGGLFGLSRCGVREIVNAAKGVGPAKAVELAAVFEMGRRMARGTDSQPRVDAPGVVYEMLAPEMWTLDRERLYVLLVNAKHRLIRTEVVSIGSLTESVAHPREILRPALIHAAFGFLLAHNHPSGDPAPSEADRRLTRRLREAAELLQIRFLDHIIIGTPEPGRLPYYSFKENHAF